MHQFQYFEHVFLFRWHHLCFVYDDNSQEISSYVDGLLNNRETYKTIGPAYGDTVILGQGTTVNADESGLSGMLTQVHLCLFRNC